ncbi:MAG: GTPase HflX [Deltaproteobacteria bacterium]|nr:GTPase HflX [Deltaproteobacteria bacterium]
MKKKLYGNTGGLKANQIHRLENLYRRRTPPELVITPELAREISKLSFELRRQIGLLLDRSGRIAYVIVGDNQKIVIPDISSFRSAAGRLKGLRCIHTHLNNEALTRDDLTDLALLNLDIIAVVTISKNGQAAEIHTGHIRPDKSEGLPYIILPPFDVNHPDTDCLDIIKALEAELARVETLIAEKDRHKENALLVSVTTDSKKKAVESLEELKELAESSSINVLDTIIQQRKKIDSRYLMGRGKLGELTILTLQTGATIIIFDQELNPSQIRSITNQTDLKVIDRTQLILDIFARRAISREGKLQVELAQLKYLLPRLITKNTAMSRLTGGIGGRGPGETKLEINRRRVRDRIRRLEKSLDSVRKHRKQQKSLRNRKGLPVISIIGYTNAGKSTLLNSLTNSSIFVENRLFATLDPSSRRLKFPEDTEVIITDTVGFIRDLPKELMVAFRATLEELEGADLLLHVIDISNSRFKDQIASVEKIIEQLNLNRIPLINVLNKTDLVPKEFAENLAGHYNGTAISAKDQSTLMPLIQKMEVFFKNDLP